MQEEKLTLTLRAARYNAAKFDKKRSTMRAAAKAAGISVNTLASYERGAVSPRVEIVDKLCAFYGCKREDIDFGKNFTPT